MFGARTRHQGIPCRCRNPLLFGFAHASACLKQPVWVSAIQTSLESCRNCPVCQGVSICVHEQAQVADFFVVMDIRLAGIVAVAVKVLLLYNMAL